MAFNEALKNVNTLFNSDGWKIGNVAIAGETDKLWLFKSRKIIGNELTPVVVVVEKDTEDMRFYSPYDDYETRNARIIDLEQEIA